MMSSPVPDGSPFERRLLTNSTLKGTLHKTPPRRRPLEMQHTGLEPGTKVQGGQAPTHSDDAKTMIKSKRLEPCGRCQVMTAVRVALPCGRLVNLCIPCASTFARFLSKRIRDLARETNYSSSDQYRGAKPDQHDAEVKDGREKLRGRSSAISKEKGPKGRNLDSQPASSPLEIANEQLNALDVTVGAARGRKGHIPDNAGGGLSPTFRARKASPQQRSLSGSSKDVHARAQNLSRRDVQLGHCTSPMIVADPGIASTFARAPSEGQGGSNPQMPSRSSHSSAALHQFRDLDSHTAWSPAASKSYASNSGRQAATSKSDSSGRIQSTAQMAAPDSASAHGAREKPQHRSSSGGSNLGGARGREPERERHVLPHGRTIVQTALSDNKAPTYFPELRGARSDVQSPQLARMHSDGIPAGGYGREPRSHGVHNALQQHAVSKESAVRRERGPNRSSSQHQGQHDAVAALDKFDQKMSPKSSRRHADLADSTKEIRRRMMEDLRAPSGGSHIQSWNNGNSGKKTAAGHMPLKFALSSVT
jgi:hypothetical protein